MQNQSMTGPQGRDHPRRSLIVTVASVVSVLAAVTVPVVALANGSRTSGSASHGGTAGIASSSKPTFAVLQTDGSISYFVDQGDGAVAEGKKLGANVKVYNENNSASTTISDIQQAIANGVKGLIVVAPTEQLGPRMVKLANAAKVPIIALDNGFAGANGKQVPYVGISGAQFGHNSGALMMRVYKNSKWPAASTYMLLVTNPSLQTIQQRTNGERATAIKEGFPKGHIINEPTSDNVTQQAYSATGPIKVSHPQASYWLVTGGNDDVAFGAAKALVAGGVPASHIDAVGLGGDLACTIWAKGAASVGFRASNYIYPNGVGAAAVNEMYQHVVKHKPFKANVDVAPVVLTQKNLHKVDKSCK